MLIRTANSFNAKFVRMARCSLLLVAAFTVYSHAAAPIRLSRKTVFASTSAELAEGYLDASYKVLACQIAHDGATIHISLGGEELTLSKESSRKYLPILKERLTLYEDAIRARGYRKLPEAFVTQASEDCANFDLQSGPALISQDSFYLTLVQNGMKHRGVIVDSSVAFEHFRSPEVRILGQVSDVQIRCQIKLSGFAATSRPAGCELVMTHPERIDKEFAHTYFQRAILGISDGNFSSAIVDLDKSTSLDPEFAMAFSVRSLLRAQAPDAKIRSGQLAIADATKACELTDWNDWQCMAPLATAHAESGDFDAATTWMSKALESAPAAQKGELLAALNNFRMKKPLRFSRTTASEPEVPESDAYSWSAIENAAGASLDPVRELVDGHTLYKLSVTGADKDKVFDLWSEKLGNHSGPSKLHEGLAVDEHGILCAESEGKMLAIGLSSIDMLPGEPILLWIASTDGSFQAKTRFVPIPLENNDPDTGYGLAAELVNPSGVYVVEMKGFDAQEHVQASIMQGDSKVELGELSLSATERSAVLMDPRVYGRSGGTAVLTVVGRKGQVSLNLPWGDSLLAPRR